MRIGIAGAGGIESNVAVQLVRGGIHYLKVVDFDHVAGDFKTEAGGDNPYAPEVIPAASIMSRIVFKYGINGGPV